MTCPENKSRAIVLARQCQARLILLHVEEFSSALSYLFPEETTEIERRHVAEAHRLLDAVVAPDDRHGLDLRTVVKSGDAADEIIFTARDERADLLVMGAHDRGGLGRAIGSVAKRVLEELDILVVIARRIARTSPIRQILFATDFSESSRIGLHSALELSQIMRSNLIAIHAVDVDIEGGAEAAVYLGEKRLEEADAKLQELKAHAPQHNFDVNAVLAEGSVADTIIKTAQEKSADLIAIATSRREDASVAEALITDSPVPVLVVPVGELGNEKSPANMPAA